MRIKLLMNLEGAATGKTGDVVTVDTDTALMLINFQLAEQYVFKPRPKRPPIVIHTRSSKCTKEPK